MLAAQEPVLARLHEFRWRFPEYWLIFLSISAWIVLAAMPLAHAHRPAVLPNLSHWAVMVVAMMLPLQIRAIRLTAEHSLWSRRDRAVALFAGAYAGVWIVAGVPLAVADSAFHLRHRIDWPLAAAIVLLVTGAWLVLPLKRLAERLCHRVPTLSPLGAKADRDCLRYGCTIALGCVLNCWPLMLACWFFSHNLVVMLLAFALGWTDRHYAPNYRAFAASYRAALPVPGDCKGAVGQWPFSANLPNPSSPGAAACTKPRMGTTAQL